MALRPLLEHAASSPLAGGHLELFCLGIITGIPNGGFVRVQRTALEFALGDIAGPLSVNSHVGMGMVMGKNPFLSKRIHCPIPPPHEVKWHCCMFRVRL